MVAMLYRNVKLGKSKKLTGWRRVSIGSWRPTGDSSIYSRYDMPMREVLKLCSQKNINYHSFLMRALGMTIERNPHINSIIRYKRIYWRKNIDIFFHVVADEDGEDLAGLKIENTNEKSIEDIDQEFKQKVREIKEQGDIDFKGSKFLFKVIPGFLSKCLLDLVGLVQYTFNIWSPLFGNPRDSFGSIMLTSVGSLGIDHTFSPIAPYTRIPMVISAGMVKKRPMVVEDQVVAVETIPLCFTYDHRIMDGLQFAQLMETLKDYFRNPEEVFHE
jgi:pyruvate/2-oxoglutarate dehydrogenase complex dihydrolipoamide acyltransferase (E2) component